MLHDILWLTLWRFRHGRVETIHVITPVTVVTEQELILEEMGQQKQSTHQTSAQRPIYNKYNIWMQFNSRHSLRCRTCCSTCTLCTASDTSSQRPSSQEWTAGRRGGLHGQQFLLLPLSAKIPSHSGQRTIKKQFLLVSNAPERPQSEQDTSSSDWPVLWLVLESPRQKSQ